MSGRRGFTIVEVLVAVSLMLMVMTGVMLVTTSALRNHFQQIRSGQDSTAELFGIDDMVRTFENTTHLEWHYPDTTSSGANYQEVRGCLNWSQAMSPPGPIDYQGSLGPAPPNPVAWYDYCWSGPGGNGPSGMATLFKYYQKTASCPAGAWPAITAANCGSMVGGVTPDAAIINFYPLGYPNSQPMFTRNWSGGVDMKFMVGIATPSYGAGMGSPPAGVPPGYQVQAVPVVYNMSTGSGMQKNYNSPLCGGNPCD